MLRLLTQVPAFLLILSCYFALMDIAASLPGTIYHFASMLWNAAHGRKGSSPPVARVTRVKMLSGPMVLVGVLVSFAMLHLWNAEWMLVWRSPILLVCWCGFTGVQLIGAGSYMPVARGQATFSGVALLLLVSLVVVGVSAQGYIHTDTFKWGFITANVLALLLYSVEVFRNRMVLNIERFGKLDRQDDELRDRLQKLEHTVKLVADPIVWRNLQQGLERARKHRDEAFKLLSRNKLDEAELLLAEASVEVGQAFGSAVERLETSLPDELEVKLQHCLSDIDLMINTSASEGLGASHLKALKTKADGQLQTLKAHPMGADKLLEQLEPVENLHREVLEIRTALRLRQDMESTIFPLRQDIQEGQKSTELMLRLGLDVGPIQGSLDAWALAIDELESAPPKSVHALLVSFRNVHNRRENYLRTAMSARVLLEKGWESRKLHSEVGSLTVYVPKCCRSNEFSVGALLLEPDDPNPQTLQCKLRATLLDLQSDPCIKIQQNSGQRYSVATFSFAGKRGGKGSLELKIRNGEWVSFVVDIIPSAKELATTSFLFAGAPVAGVLTVGLRFLAGMDLASASGLAAAFGGTAGLLFFLLRMSFRRKTWSPRRNGKKWGYPPAAMKIDKQANQTKLDG